MVESKVEQKSPEEPKETGILRKSSLVANEDLRAEFQTRLKKRVSFSNWTSESSFNDSVSSLSSFHSTAEPKRRDSLTSEPRRRNSIPARTSSSSSISSISSDLQEHERSERLGCSRQFGLRLMGRNFKAETPSNKDALTIEENVGGTHVNLIAVFEG